MPFFFPLPLFRRRLLRLVTLVLAGIIRRRTDLIVLSLLIKMPESPHFLVTKHRNEEAKEAM